MTNWCYPALCGDLWRAEYIRDILNVAVKLHNKRRGLESVSRAVKSFRPHNGGVIMSLSLYASSLAYLLPTSQYPKFNNLIVCGAS